MCYKATEANKKMTLREFWKYEYNILDCVKPIVSAWKEFPDV